MFEDVYKLKDIISIYKIDILNLYKMYLINNINIYLNIKEKYTDFCEVTKVQNIYN